MPNMKFNGEQISKIEPFREGYGFPQTHDSQ